MRFPKVLDRLQFIEVESGIGLDASNKNDNELLPELHLLQESFRRFEIRQP